MAWLNSAVLVFISNAEGVTAMILIVGFTDSYTCFRFGYSSSTICAAVKLSNELCCLLQEEIICGACVKHNNNSVGIEFRPYGWQAKWERQSSLQQSDSHKKDNEQVNPILITPWHDSTYDKTTESFIDLLDTYVREELTTFQPEVQQKVNSAFEKSTKDKHSFTNPSDKDFQHYVQLQEPQKTE